MAKGYRPRHQTGGTTDPLSAQKSFFSTYLQSPKYMERLKKQGYANPNQIMKDRLARLRGTSFADVTGTGLGSEYKKEDNRINYDNDESKKYGMSKESVKTHELAHAAGAMNVFAGRSYNDPIGLNTNDIQAIDKRNKLAGRIMDDDPHISHDSRASEFKADMDTLRYYMKKDKIYDAGTQDFNPEFLKKAKEKYGKDKNINRLFERAKDDDLIWLMNNVAYQQQEPSTMAQMGGTPDLKSLYGYSSKSPYRSAPFLDINTPEGIITMANTPHDVLAMDNLGDVQLLKAHDKTPYKFRGNVVREIPIKKQMGGNPYQNGGISNEQLYGYLFDDDEEDEAVAAADVPEEIEDEDKAPALQKSERLLQQRLDDEEAMNQATMNWGDNPYRRNVAMEGGWDDGLDLGDDTPMPSNMPTTYSGQISSGKWGDQNIGQYGRQIISDVTNALGYTPQFNSIFRDKAQQDKLIAQGVGAKNSYHLTGDAVDMKPADWNNLPPEKKMYFRANYDVIYHNNHYHIEPK